MNGIKDDYQCPDYNTAINDQPPVAIAGSIGFVPQQPAQQQTSVQYQPPPPNPYGQQPPQNYGQQPPNTQPVVIIHQGRGNRVGPQHMSAQPLYRAQFIWGIVNAILFFPLYFFWIPALLVANNSKKNYLMNNYPIATRYARNAQILNLVCTILGVISALIWIVTLSTIYTNYSSAVYISSGRWSGCYSHPSYSYFVCYSDKVSEDCYYSRAYDFNRETTSYFWKCQDD